MLGDDEFGGGTAPLRARRQGLTGGKVHEEGKCWRCREKGRRVIRLECANPTHIEWISWLCGPCLLTGVRRSQLITGEAVMQDNIRRMSKDE